MYCNRLHVWWSTQLRLASLLSSLVARWWVGLLTLWRFRLKYFSIDEMVGAWCFGCCQVHRVLPIVFLLCIQFYVLFSPYLCFISFLYLDLYILGDDRRLSYKPNIYVSWSTSKLRMRLAPWNPFKPSSKIFLLTVTRRYFFCGPFVLFMSCVCHAYASVHCYLVVTCWERADHLALVCDVYLCISHFSMWYPG